MNWPGPDRSVRIIRHQVGAILTTLVRTPVVGTREITGNDWSEFSIGLSLQVVDNLSHLRGELREDVLIISELLAKQYHTSNSGSASHASSFDITMENRQQIFGRPGERLEDTRHSLRKDSFPVTCQMLDDWFDPDSGRSVCLYLYQKRSYNSQLLIEVMRALSIRKNTVTSYDSYDC